MSPMPAYPDLTPAAIPGLCAELLGHAGEWAAVSDASALLGAIERECAAAPPEDEAAWHDGAEMTRKTWATLRRYVEPDEPEPEPEPERPPLVPLTPRMPRRCEVRRRVP